MANKDYIYIVLDQYFPKNKNILSQMAEELALGLIKKNEKVIVIAPDEDIQKNETINIRGVDVKFFRNPRIKNVNYVKRTINEFLLSFNAIIRLRSFMKIYKPSYIIYFSPSIFFGLYIFYVKLFYKVKSYLVLRDIFPQWIVDIGLINKIGPTHLFFKIFESINYSAASKIGIESPSGLKEFETKYKKYNLELLFNWIENKPVPYKKKSLRKIYGLENKIIFFYGGNIGLAQDILNIVKLANNLVSYQDAHFVIVGNGDEFMKIEASINSYELKNITLLEGVDPEVYIDYLQEIDVGMISLNKKNTGNNIPGKLLNYMKLKKPILGSVNSGNDIINIINNSNSGLISINGQDDIFANNAKQFLDANKRNKFSHNSFLLMSKNFSIHSALEKILNHKND